MPLKSKKSDTGQKVRADVDPSYCNNVVLRQAARRMGQLYDDVIGPSGLRATQQGLLSHIAHLGSPALRQLAQAMVMDLSALGHTLKPLARDGLITIVPDETDGRVKRVALTPKGLRVLDDGMTRWQDAQNAFAATFGSEKAARLRETLSLIASQEFADLFNRNLKRAAS